MLIVESLNCRWIYCQQLKTEQLNNYQLKKILTLSFGGFSVLYGIDRAMVVASHADSAIAMPCGLPVFERNVLQRTHIHALAAMNTCFGDVIFRVIGSKAIESWIDHVAFQPSQAAHNHFGKTFLFL